ncbi:MAG TPA: hypothetical protein DCL35_06125 [Candidatus Omnitrophica bacterium]|nr:hypothetical protein [Candidatus Omnitrophota bacterium]
MSKKILKSGIYCIGKLLEFFTCLILFPKLRSYKKLRGARTNRRFLVFYNKENVFKVVKFSDAYGLKLLISLLGNKEFNNYKATLKFLGSLEFLNKHIAELTDVHRAGSYGSRYINGYDLQSLSMKQREPGDSGLLKDTEVILKIKVAVSELLDSLRSYNNKYGFLIGDWHLSNLLYEPKLKRIINVDLEGFYTYNINTKFNLYRIFENDLDWVEEQLKGFCGSIDFREV